MSPTNQLNGKTRWIEYNPELNLGALVQAAVISIGGLSFLFAMQGKINLVENNVKNIESRLDRELKDIRESQLRVEREFLDFYKRSMLNQTRQNNETHQR